MTPDGGPCASPQAGPAAGAASPRTRLPHARSNCSSSTPRRPSSGWTYDYDGAVQSVIRTEASSSIPYQDVFFATDVNGLIVNRYEQYDPGTVGGNPLPVTHTYRFGGKEMGLVTNNSTTNIDYATLIDRARRHAGDRLLPRRGDQRHALCELRCEPHHAGGRGAGRHARQLDRARRRHAAIDRDRRCWGDASQWYKLAQANGGERGRARRRPGAGDPRRDRQHPQTTPHRSSPTIRHGRWAMSARRRRSRRSRTSAECSG